MAFNLIASSVALNRLEEANVTIAQTQARGIDGYLLHLGIYCTAFLRNDQASMQQQLTWAVGRSGEEDWFFSAQADTEAYYGRLAKFA